MSLGDVSDLCVGDFSSVVSVNHYGDRIGDTDGVRNLHLRSVRETRGDDVLGYVPCGVCT